MEDEDALIQGDEEKGGNLDRLAIAEQEARTAERRRVKQKAVQRKTAPHSDSDLPDPKRRSQSGGKDAGAGGKGRESGGN